MSPLMTCLALPGIAELENLKSVYDPSLHPRVLTGELKEEQAYKEFLHYFDGTRFGKKKERMRVDFSNVFTDCVTLKWTLSLNTGDTRRVHELYGRALFLHKE